MTGKHEREFASFSCLRSFRVFVLIFVLSCTSAAALNLNLTTSDIERALVIARGRDNDRARFHAPYITTVNDPTLQSVEVISEFRRVVLVAEERYRLGDRPFAYSSRVAEEAVKVWKSRVNVIARLRFHPLNTYVGLPNIGIKLDGPRADDAFLGVRAEPLLAMSSGRRGENVPILGAVAEASFDAPVIGQTRRTATIMLDGKEIGRVPLDFAAVE
jgi:hypothetical protein